MTARHKAVIVGTGGHAQMMQATFHVALPQDVNLVGWLAHPEYDGASEIAGLPVFIESEAGLAQLKAEEVDSFYFGIGMVKPFPARLDTFNRLCEAGLIPLSLVHPAAVVSPLAEFGAGCFIGPKVIVQPYALIGPASILNSGCIIEHHVRVGGNSHVAPGAILCGEVNVGEHAMIGAGSIILQGLAIENNVCIGAGSVVLHPVKSGDTIAGNPARPVHAPSSAMKD